MAPWWGLSISTTTPVWGLISLGGSIVVVAVALLGVGVFAFLLLLIFLLSFLLRWGEKDESPPPSPQGLSGGAVVHLCVSPFVLNLFSSAFVALP